MIILGNTLLPNDRGQAIPADCGTTIKPTPVTDNVTDVVVAPIITTVSSDSNTEVFYNFYISFSIYDFYL